MNNYLLKRKDKNPASQKGSVVFGVLILTAILISGLAAGLLIVREIELTSNFDNSTTAYYAAESGIEKALYMLKNKVDPETDPTGTILGGLTVPEGSFAITVSPVNLNCLPKDSPRQVHLDADFDNTVSCIEIDWDPPTATCDSTSGSIPWIEYKTYEFSPTGTSQVKVVNEASGISNNAPISIKYFNPVFTEDYFIRFKPLQSGASNVLVTAYDNETPFGCSGNSITLMAETHIRVEGIYSSDVAFTRQATRVLEVDVSSRSQHGVFDYVLFSDQGLIKEP